MRLRSLLPSHDRPVPAAECCGKVLIFWFSFGTPTTEMAAVAESTISFGCTLIVQLRDQMVFIYEV
jgi:hypothetical protein